VSNPTRKLKMKKEILRKYKDHHVDNPQNIGPALISKTKNNWESEYWLREQYNRNRPFNKHKRLRDVINSTKHPTQEETIRFNRKENKKNETVNHPNHYGGEDNPYEAIKVIEEWDLGFNLGNVIKYVSRAGKKQDKIEDLKKAAWYINRELKKLK